MNRVLHLFSEHQHVGALPVVENGRPMGIINRNQFMSQLAAVSPRAVRPQELHRLHEPLTAGGRA